MVEKDKGAEYIEAQKKELLDRIATAFQVWTKAGEVGDGVLKQKITGRVFSQASGLMERLQRAEDFEIVAEGSAIRTYRLGGVDVMRYLTNNEIFLTLSAPQMHDVKEFSFVFDRMGINCNFTAEVVEPEKSSCDGYVKVQVDLNGAEIKQIFYNIDISEEGNVPGAFFKQETRIRKGKITRDLQMAGGPPHYM